MKERTLHQQMYGVFIDSRSSTGRHFPLSSEQFFYGASSWSLLQAFCVPSWMATLLQTTVK